MRHDVKTLFAVMVILVCSVWLAGCTSVFTGQKSAETQSGTTLATASSPRTTAVYYEFEDVLIPLELSVLQDRSMIVSTPGFASGILAFRGRVERRSLINFFNSNMQKDNWSQVSQIASPTMAILVFEKPLKSAVISIRTEPVYTYVEVGVAARTTQSALPRNTGTPVQSSGTPVQSSDTPFQSSDLTQ